MKKIIALVTLLAMCLTAIPVFAEEGRGSIFTQLEYRIENEYYIFPADKEVTYFDDDAQPDREEEGNFTLISFDNENYRLTLVGFGEDGRYVGIDYYYTVYPYPILFEVLSTYDELSAEYAADGEVLMINIEYPEGNIFGLDSVLVDSGEKARTLTSGGLWGIFVQMLFIDEVQPVDFGDISEHVDPVSPEEQKNTQIWIDYTNNMIWLKGLNVAGEYVTYAAIYDDHPSRFWAQIVVDYVLWSTGFAREGETLTIVLLVEDAVEVIDSPEDAAEFIDALRNY